jgi:hypothetical protein
MFILKESALYFSHHLRARNEISVFEREVARVSRVFLACSVPLGLLFGFGIPGHDKNVNSLPFLVAFLLVYPNFLTVFSISNTNETT